MVNFYRKQLQFYYSMKNLADLHSQILQAEELHDVRAAVALREAPAVHTKTRVIPVTSIVAREISPIQHWMAVRKYCATTAI